MPVEPRRGSRSNPPPSPRRAAPGAGAGWWAQRRAAKKRRLAAMSRKRRIARRFGLATTWLLGLLALLLTVAAVGVYQFVNVPSPDSLVTNQLATLTYADGSPIATVGAENRVSVPLSKVPDHVRWAVIAAEDRNFYSEPGVSLRGTLRAALNDVRGGAAQGGSTITQQYVKNAYLNADQTLTRKLKEAAISLKLSREYSKDQILENYLNIIYFGRGAYGIEAAAKAYFNVDVSKLTVAQGALLAAVIKSPEYYDPRITPTAAKQRWTYVVDGMLSIGKLSAADRAKLQFPPTVKGGNAASNALDGPMGMVWDQVKKELKANNIDESQINARGLKIQTTIDKSAEQDALDAINQHFSNLQSFQKNLRSAFVAVNPANGGVLAYYGGPKHGDLDYAGQAYRPPGSSFKPYTLATALTQNIRGKKPAYAISSQYNGSFCVTIQATQVCNDPSDQWVSSDHVTLANAMKYSLNTAYDGLANEIGPKNVADTAHAMGIAPIRTDTGKPSLQNAKTGQTTFGIGIGDSDYAVRPIDQAVGFATIADGGITRPPYFVQKVTDSSGSLVFQHKDGGTRSLDPRVANDTAVAMKDVASWSHVPLDNGRPCIAKTGTAGISLTAEGTPDNSRNNSDAWMVGGTPQVSAASWVGSGESQPIYNSNHLPEYGSDLAAHIWQQFMNSYLSGKDILPMPTQQQILSGTNVPTSAPPSTSASKSSSASTSATPSKTPTKTSAPPPTTSAPPPVSPKPVQTCSGGIVGVICPSSSSSSPTPTPSPKGSAATTAAGG